MLVTGIIYFIGVRSEKIKPNPTSLSIWVIVGSMNTWMFWEISRDFYSTLTLFTATAVTTITFFYSLFKKKFPRPSMTDLMLLVLAFTIGIGWQTSGNSNIGNALLQLVYIVSFTALVLGLKEKHNKETIDPWVTSFFACLFLTAKTILTYNGNIFVFSYPLITGVLGNGLVAILVYRSNKKTLQ
jgi:hypothetical protein